MSGKLILYIPQLSMYDKKNKKFLPEADGNINMMRNTIKEWQRNRPDDIFCILLPYAEEIFKFSYLIPGNKLFYRNYIQSARTNRFNFPFDELSNILKSFKFDLIINDVIELTTNFKQLFNFNLGYNPKIISNIRHIDNNINHKYLYRIFDGIESSDLVTILSESMKNILISQMNEILQYYIVKEYNNKIEIFEPSISIGELAPYYIEKKIENKTNRKKIITFPGRLSKGEEKRTNYDKFLLALEELVLKRQDFEVYLTDPNNSYIDWNTTGLIKTIKKDRKEFLKLLQKTDIIVSLMNIQGFGGISIREALYFDCLPIIPYIDEYKKMSHKNYNGFIHDEITVDKLVDKLNWALDYPLIFGSQKYSYPFAIENQIKKLLEVLE